MANRNRDQNATGYRTLIQDSMQKTIRAGSIYEASRHGVPDTPDENEARIAYHISVMELFSVLRPYLSGVRQIRPDYWDGDEISPEQPHGLKNLSQWRNEVANMKRKNTSPYSSRDETVTEEIARPLSPRDAFHAADALLAAAHELGFAPEPDLGLPHDENTLEDLKGRSPLSTLALDSPEDIEKVRNGEMRLEADGGA